MGVPPVRATLELAAPGGQRKMKSFPSTPLPFPPPRFGLFFSPFGAPAKNNIGPFVLSNKKNKSSPISLR
jgi:hypothetical protein